MKVESFNFQNGIQSVNSSVGGKFIPSVVKNKSVFDDIFNAYMGVVDKTNALQIDKDKIQVDFATGKTDDMLAVVLAQEEAAVTLDFTVQVTNKIIDAYREIMRISM